MIILVRSIQKNWNFNYIINLAICGKESEIEKSIIKKLKSLNIYLYYCIPDIDSKTVRGLWKSSRSQSYLIELAKKGTHRLIIDSDMIAIDDIGKVLPELLDYNICVMYDYDTNYKIKTQEHYNKLINKLCKKFKLKKPSEPFIFDSNQENTSVSNYHYYKHKLSSPYFNGGCILIKENLCNDFGLNIKQCGKVFTIMI